MRTDHVVRHALGLRADTAELTRCNASSLFFVAGEGEVRSEECGVRGYNLRKRGHSEPDRATAVAALPIATRLRSG